ncbi:MAG: hypothetical protein Q8Q48_00590 [Candidatus Staskawiczbacteria bacterium]|nr:hypothetical protein [Candidatus Staskawiczbacteria bacterium]
MEYNLKAFTVTYSGGDAVLAKVFEILESSKRAMPAHFCGNSFEVEWDGLNRSAEYNMASAAWNVNFDRKRFDPEVLSSLATGEYSFVVLLSEHIMLGSYALAKLEAEESLYADLLDLILAGFEVSGDRDLAQKIISAGIVHFKYCVSYGKGLAVAG